MLLLRSLRSTLYNGALSSQCRLASATTSYTLSKGVCVRIDAPLSARQEFFERQCLHHELFFCTRIPEVLEIKFETSMSVPTRESFSS